MEAGFSFKICARAIEEFVGIERRFQFRKESGGVLFYDDYGHHPTEVRVVLQAFKELFKNRRLVVCFQPHRYTRTRACWQEFLKSFGHADLLFVTDIYPASEPFIDGVDSEKFCAEVDHGHVIYIKQSNEGLEKIRHHLKERFIYFARCW